MKLRTKIIILLTPLIAIPIIVIGIIAYNLIHNQSENIIFNQSNTLLNQVGINIQLKLENAKANIKLFANSDTLIQYLLIQDEANRYAIMQLPLLNLFASYAAVYPEYYQIRVIMPDGYEDTRFAAKDIPNISSEEGETLWFKELKESNDKNIFLKFFEDPDTKKLAIILAKKIMYFDKANKTNTLLGYLVMNVSADFIEQQIKNNKIGYIFLSDDKGNVIYHPYESFLTKTLSDTQLQKIKDIGETKLPIETDYIKKSVFLFSKKLASNMMLISVLPKSDLLSASNDLKFWVSIVILTSIFFMLVVIIFGMNKILFKSIKKLSEANIQVSKGDFEIRIQNNRKDEIGELFKTFNMMINDLWISNEKIKNNQIDLENQVNERTLNLKKMNEELIIAKSEAELISKLKSEFLSNISHEIRTPLNGIIGIAELAKDIGIDKKQKQLFNMIYQESIFLLSIINDILDLSKLEADKIILENIPFNLKNVLEEVTNRIMMQAKQKGLKYSYAIEENIPLNLIGDPHRLSQILLNMIGNALKFTNNGEINVNVRYTNLADNKLKLIVTVRDTGIGIPKEKQKLIFESFVQADGSTTRKFGGAGLGTTISKQLTELMGGEIGFESEEGKGSIFWFTVVFDIQQFEYDVSNVYDIEDVSKEVADNLKQKTFKILLVEDYPTNQQVALMHLQNAGYEVDIAENGEEAVRAYAQDKYDLILMDIQMPVMDGYDATRAIRELEIIQNLKRIPIIAMTAHAMEGYKENCLSCGMDDYMTKPFKRKSLIAIVKKWTEKDSYLQDNSNQKTEMIKELINNDPIDIKTLLDELDNDKAFMKKLVLGFIENARKGIETIDNAIKIGDLETVKKVSHTIKGGSGNLTAKYIQEAALRLEEIVKSGNLEILSEGFNILLKEFHRLEVFSLNFMNQKNGE